MIIHATILSFSFLLIIILLLKFAQSSNTPNSPTYHYLINFGLSKSSTQPPWQSDEDFQVTIPSTNVGTSARSLGAKPPYDVARIFRAPLNYSIPILATRSVLIRLYFPPLDISYDTMDTSNAFISLTINGREILRNFNAYMVATHTKDHPNTNAPVSIGVVKEIYMEVDGALNMTFSPSNPRGFGFINGMEVISIPNDLYRTSNNNYTVPMLMGGGDQDYADNSFVFPNTLTMENIIRLNVGGLDIDPDYDTGIRRMWYNDQNFVVSNGNLQSNTRTYNTNSTIHYTELTPTYTAPALMYSTMRENSALNWSFEVDIGFDYLVRLHFCELDKNITQTRRREFYIRINNQKASDLFDVSSLAGGQKIPMYRDYVTHFGRANGTETNSWSKGLLWVTLLPGDGDAGAIYDNPFLNGLEIFKLSSTNDSLAAPNPTLVKDRISNHLFWIIGGSAFGFIFVSFTALLCFMIIYRMNKAKRKASRVMNEKQDLPVRGHESATLPSVHCQRFSLAQIRLATFDFDESLIIGNGGFGKVYKGIIDDGEAIFTVAIKRLNPGSKQGAREFQTEIEMLSRLRHMHLVSLIGFCNDQGEMILVYEYMSQGNLRDHLINKDPESNHCTTNPPLPWKQRLLICVGAARGLHYLHEGAEHLIIHRDVKSTNILLDNKLVAKISDFGISKVGPTVRDGDNAHVSTAVRGTFGYLDPEYYRTEQLTEKSDVYSFGVVLFEVLCARSVIRRNLPAEEKNLAIWGSRCYRSGVLHNIVDSNLAGQIAPECFRKFGEIAEMCVRERASERPLMRDVVQALEFALQLQEIAEQNIVDGPWVLSPMNNNFEYGSEDDSISTANWTTSTLTEIQLELIIN